MRRGLLFALPLLAFIALALVFFVRLEGGGGSSVVPSALIGRPAPALTLAPLEGLTHEGAQVPGIQPADFAGKVTVVNFWASWCAPCRREHRFLVELARDSRIRVVGVNQKDQGENARRFLGQIGNPFAAVGVDPNGRASIEWGVYGLPETFLVSADGVVVHKIVGELTEANLPVLRAKIDEAIGSRNGNRQ